MTVRPASPADVDALVAAYDWLFAPPGSQPPMWDPVKAAERLGAAIDGERSAVFVAGEPIAGFCTVYLDVLSVRYGQRAWVEDLAVDAAQRSQGLGKALLDAAREWARERGATHLELDSGDARADAHRFYEREAPAWRARSFGYLL